MTNKRRERIRWPKVDIDSTSPEALGEWLASYHMRILRATLLNAAVASVELSKFGEQRAQRIDEENDIDER